MDERLIGKLVRWTAAWMHEWFAERVNVWLDVWLDGWPSMNEENYVCLAVQIDV